MSTAPPETERRHQVLIHIDQKPYYSPNPTMGRTLYLLAGIQEDQELYREVTGNREDQVVLNDSQPIHLNEDEHFHSGSPLQKEFIIIVNGRKKKVDTRELTFDQVVALAFNPVPTGENILFTITYDRGPRANPEGSLLEGQTVKIKTGMVFNVTATDKS